MSLLFLKLWTVTVHTTPTQEWIFPMCNALRVCKLNHVEPLRQVVKKEDQIPAYAEPLSVPPWLRSNPAIRTSSLQEAAWPWACPESCLWKCSAEQQWCIEALFWNSCGWGGGFGRSIIYIVRAASRTCGAMYLFVPSDFMCWHLILPMLLAILTSISRSFLGFRLKGSILRNKAF